MKGSTILLAMFMTILSFSSVFGGFPNIAYGQASMACDVIVIINSASTDVQDFYRFIKPYLDQFGFPYTILDISTTPVTAAALQRALIVAGHKNLDPTRSYLDTTEEGYILAAVEQGTGLVNFGNADSTYQFVQEIFNFGYAGSVTGSSIKIVEGAGDRHYIISAQPIGNTISLKSSITLPNLSVPPSDQILVTAGTWPLLIATQYGQGRALQWASYDWASASKKGPVYGLDDLVWRGLVWAARKPFVMRGFPPFLTMRIDDSSGEGDFRWAEIASSHGIKPWIGLHLDNVRSDPDCVVALKRLVDAGNATTNVHSYDDSRYFYFNHPASADYDDATVATHFADADNFFSTYQIAKAKYILPHSYEFGTNVFGYLKNWGVEFIGTVYPVGQREDEGGWPIRLGPYRLYEELWDYLDPFYYGDWIPIANHPEFDHQFFNVLTEIRDNAGYEWFPDNDVQGSISRGTAQTKRALDSMVLATLFSHEQHVVKISDSNWNAILTGILENLASYDLLLVTMDYAAQYARAMVTSRASASSYEPSTGLFAVTFTGYADMTTKLYLFTDGASGITSQLMDVPFFTNGYTFQFYLAGPNTADVAITKSVAAYAHVGDMITYSFAVTNNGPADAENVIVTDNLLGGQIFGPATLSAGQSATFTRDYSVKATDPDPLWNTATVSSSTPDHFTGNNVGARSVDILHPGISIEKTSDKTTVFIGETVTYTYTVTSSGDAALSEVSVVDNVCGTASYLSGDANGNSKLDPTETWIFRKSYTVGSGDSNPLVNVANASGRDSLGMTVTASDSWSVGVTEPLGYFGKTTSGANTMTFWGNEKEFARFQLLGSGTVSVAKITFYCRTQSGTIRIRTGIYSDSSGSPNTLLGQTQEVVVDTTWGWRDFVFSTPVTLSRGAWYWLGEQSNGNGEFKYDKIGKNYHAYAYDSYADGLASTFGTHGKDDAEMSIYATLTGPSTTANLAITKSGPVRAHVGDVITYTFSVTNNGPSAADNVVVTDNLLGGQIFGPARLSAGQFVTFSVNYLVKTTDSDPLRNTATVTSTTPDPDASNNEATYSLDILHPSVSVEKTSDKTAVSVGETITYTYTVKNLGDAALSEVSVVDNVCGTASYLSGDANGDNRLDLAETWVYTASYTVKEGDSDPLVNTATASGKDALGMIVTANDTWSVRITATPADVVVTKLGPAYAHVGDTITYSFTVTNNGPADAENVIVTDNLLGGQIFGPVNLAAGQSATFSVNYLVKATDPDPLVNTASVSSTTPDRDTSNNMVTFTVDVLHPAISVDKTADKTTASVGETITYTFTVTNPGDAPLSDIAMVDDVCGIAAYQGGDTNGNGKLDPSETWIYRASYTVGSGAPNPLVNVGTTSGRDALGVAVSTFDSWSVTVTQLSGYFGKTNIGANTMTFWRNEKEFARFQLSGSGTVSVIKLTFYCRATSGTIRVRAGIYSDNNGSPDKLLGQTQEVTVDTTWGWRDFVFSTPVTLSRGAWYWLGEQSNKDGQLRYDTIGQKYHAWATDSYTDGLAATFGTHGKDDAEMSIYATLTESSASQSATFSTNYSVQATGLLLNAATFGSSVRGFFLFFSALSLLNYLRESRRKVWKQVARFT